MVPTETAIIIQITVNVNKNITLNRISSVIFVTPLKIGNAPSTSKNNGLIFPRMNGIS